MTEDVPSEFEMLGMLMDIVATIHDSEDGSAEDSELIFGSWDIGVGEKDSVGEKKVSTVNDDDITLDFVPDS